LTRFWWVRHGPTHEKTFVGWRNVPADLSDLDQISRLDAHLPRGSVLLSSDLSRAIETADAIGGGRERLAHDPALREFNFGQWDGVPFDTVAARDPELSRAFWEDPGDVAPPGGESWNEVAARVGACVDALSQSHAGRDIVIVAHIGVIMTQVMAASGMTAQQVLGHRIDNLSVTRLEMSGGRWSVGAINHLP